MEKFEDKEQLKSKIERLRTAIEINESYDLPTEVQHALLDKYLSELKEMEMAEKAPDLVKEVELKSPFRGDSRPSVEDCYLKCSEALEDCGMGILGSCCGCDCCCKCIRTAAHSVLILHPDENVWVHIHKGGAHD